jgi:glycosyltransferase involved in cell wall biosynthesis
MPSGAVSFTGELPASDVSRVLADMDFAILPFPTGVSTGRSTFMNCAAHALPIVTTCDEENCPAELRNGENVLLYRCGDQETLVNLVQELCRDALLNERLSKNIFATAQIWSWDELSRSHIDMYQTAIAGHGGAMSALSMK